MHKNRSIEDIKEIGIIPRYGRVLIHDCMDGLMQRSTGCARAVNLWERLKDQEQAVLQMALSGELYVKRGE